MRYLKKDTKRQRKFHNQDLIRRMRNGESLSAIDSKASWYPPRPNIKKDAKEMARLYGQFEGEGVDIHEVGDRESLDDAG